MIPADRLELQRELIHFRTRYVRSLSDWSPCAILYLMKVRDVIRMIERDGWYLAATRGSHRQYKHPEKTGRVTIAGHPGDDLAPGTLNSVLKQARLK